ncbi:bifunctional diaminohydroxyphosphoribosylaminopyrimidine deaminase/5-amino-6-(5-phosphoribosylamino)uracil reductase RibD [Allorhizobium sp. BGMRC 0089]|uniref:bifunctional diaminohydroxyphosphoribosylaminopyrimidine deaminase/5-amino-6-(5-phosphoribosylamino)uracil reductase RibD n=1 Tax=Allorhizobium sonneratiae TaxID=2934936 RepID=UPI0020347F6C|nr:bifunctional diaminohydroxyphosphoribosylaminopyrimidine deaminase/5-amino-6-(5-phosphoribosylamino)uracil reductase RibD [Allorhizobium sonneratiae]MCM2292116.1 bifunctional diaminohydroxyphosphoribosylaminopyrimidine deaminase/5-amino-6-(5-phosphoribosylamino)uracil reductase RibD [Allorhizobium sonneratiae]
MIDPRDDERFMGAAIRIARQHLGQTSTNPSVGCVIVRDGLIVGAAVTARGGRPHAETQALAKAGEAARGATAYVTLEPCAHYGRTPPCANALVAAGVARVVIAVVDPDPRVSGGGIGILRDAGIVVEIGVLQKQAMRDLRPYLIRHVEKRAHVTLKLAISADGMIGRQGEGQVAITGPIARTQVQLLRAETDAILVGIGTAKADNPELTVRLTGMDHLSPFRIVLDRRCELPVPSKLADTTLAPTICACCGDEVFRCDEASQSRSHALQAVGVEVWQVESLAALLNRLAEHGLSSLMVEGGAAVAKAFLDQDLVDRIHLYQGAGLVGPEGLASPLTKDNIPSAFTLFRRAVFGADLLLEYERDF